MARLIDADEVLDKIRKAFEFGVDPMTFSMAERIVKEATTVIEDYDDELYIGTCKECKHASFHANNELLTCRAHSCTMRADGFCSSFMSEELLMVLDERGNVIGVKRCDTD